MLQKTILLLYACLAPLYAGRFVITQQGEVTSAPRSSAATSLLFPLVLDVFGFDTEITISNTSQDTFGSVPESGVCVVNYYSGAFTGNQTTPVIQAGGQYVFKVSQALSELPGFTGYIIAACNFPLGRGISKVFATGDTLGFSHDAQVLTLPRSTTNPQSMLFPFVTNQNGFDTAIGLANTSLDPFGTTQTSGSCALNFYGANAPASQVTPTIQPGTFYTFLASIVAPNFQGYVIATCNFTGAAGAGFVSDVGDRIVALAETAEPLTIPRNTTARPLLFPAVTNQKEKDTGIAISNTSADPFGTTPVSGTCALNFYGINAPATVTTPTIAAGGMFTTTASSLAPGFQGYLIATCSFPLARAWAFTTPTLAPGDGDSQTPEMVTLPRSATPTGLLFSDVTNWNGSDTSITISNTSEDPFGTSQASGVCALSYFGAVGATGAAPPAQSSVMIPAGGQLSFTLSKGNIAQGIAGTPGFHGYLIANCGFPLARGLATTDGVPLAYVGVFRQGQWHLDTSGTANWSPSTDLTGNFGLPGDVPVVGDWTADGRTKVGIFRSGQWHLDTSGTASWSPPTDLTGNFGLPGDVPVVGDWTADGKTKVGIYRGGQWHLDTSGTANWSAGTDLTGNFGLPGDITVVGDWTGDGRTKVGVVRIVSGALQWHLDTSGTASWSSATDRTGYFGLQGDVPVVGDWTGDGKVKVGVFRGGQWFLDTSGTANFNPATVIIGNFGLPGDVPVVGDWTGDGRTKVGIFRNGQWHLDMSGTANWSPATDLTGNFGLPGDAPVIGHWRP